MRSRACFSLEYVIVYWGEGRWVWVVSEVLVAAVQECHVITVELEVEEIDVLGDSLGVG